MRVPIACVGATTPVREVAREILQGREAVGVLDEHGRLVGCVTRRDVLRYAEWHWETEDAAEDREDLEAAMDLWSSDFEPAEEPLAELFDPGEPEEPGMHMDLLRRVTAEQIMSRPVEFVFMNEPLSEVTRRLGEGPCSCLFVLNAAGHVAGIIHLRDLIRALHELIFRKKRKARATARQEVR